MKQLMLVCLMMVGLAGPATQAQQPDTTGPVFSAQAFYEAVTQFHPILRLGNLLPEEARAEIMQARGAFDPKLFSNLDRKEFGNTFYYQYWQTGVSAPLWPGIDLKATYERNAGRFVNPSDRVPPTGLAALGVSVPVGQTLLIDARRTAVRQAELAVNLADADRLKLINKTLFDAAKTYWDWYLAYQQYRFLSEGYELADTRFKALRQRALLGDAAIIDTTEALITVQDRLVQRQQAEVDLQNARLRVSAFLWDADRRPIDMPANIVPQQPSLTPPGQQTLQTLLDRAAQQHPDILKLQVKGQQLAIEERFRRALLQPQINLSASLLSQTPALNGAYPVDSYYRFRPENHKLTFDFVMPLFLRKERGKLRQVQLKNQQVGLERQQVSRDIANDVLAAYNQMQTLSQQTGTQQAAIQNQERLLQAEQQKFEIGESSLFLVNSRETKLIDLRVKGEELKAKFQKAVAELYFVAGTAGPSNL